MEKHMNISISRPYYYQTANVIPNWQKILGVPTGYKVKGDYYIKTFVKKNG